MHVDDLWYEYVPAGQVLQEDEIANEYVPARHTEQEEAPLFE